LALHPRFSHLNPKNKIHHLPKAARNKPITLPHPLVIANNNIPQVDEIKVLGLLFQFRHSWLPHIKSTKAKCLRALNILKVLIHPPHGCNRKILLPLYTTLIHAILDYGATAHTVTQL